MRIAHVVSTFPPYRGGQGNVAREIAERTAARGHEVVVVTPVQMQNEECRMKNADDQIHHSPFTIHHSRPRLRFGNAAWCPSIRRTLEKLHPDLVHLHWPFIGGIAPVLRWRRLQAASCQLQAASPRRFIVQYHMDLVGSGWRGAVFSAYQRRALPRLLATADRVVVSSLDYACHGALAPYIEQLGDRLVEIPFGVDVERFQPAAEQQSSRAAELRVLFVGGLDRAHAFKGVDVLLAAVARLTDGHGSSTDGHGCHGYRLRIVGHGDLRSTYEAQTRSLGINDRVEFLGSVSDEELPNIYRSADVLVLPSTSRSEAFGVVLLEAMASGLPVIASDLPGVRTVVADGETGFLVPSGDTQSLAQRLFMFAGDPALRQRMGEVARQRACQRYAWDHLVSLWEGVYSPYIA